MTDYARRLDDELKFRGMRKSDIVKGLGIPDSTVRSWWSRDAMPAADIALKVARFLGVSLEYLIDGTESEKVIIREESPRISESDKKLLEIFKELSETDREEIEEIMQMKIKRYAKKRGKEEMRGELSFISDFRHD